MAELKTFSRIPMRTWRWLGVNESRIPADIDEHVTTQKILVEAGKEDEVVLTQREGGSYELQVHLEEGAKLHLVTAQLVPDDALYTCRVKVYVGKGATFAYTVVEAGAHQTATELHVDLAGDDSKADTAVCDAICRADAENAVFYRANCENYCAQLEDLDARFAALCESAPRRLLIFADRFPMLYFCREYGLDYRAAFHGCSGDTEPSLATIKFLIDKVEDEDIPVVYTIDFGTKKVAAVVSECTGAAIETLYSMQTVSRADFDAGETYLTLMERNFEALRKGLNA